MKLRNVLSAMAAVVLVAVSGAAAAQSTSPTNKVTASQPTNSNALATALLLMPAADIAAKVAGAVSAAVFGGTSGGLFGGLDAKRYSLSNSTGAAAAPGAKQWNVWGAVSRSNVAYNFAPLQSNGTVNVYIAGLDYTFDNNMIFGVATAIDRSDFDLNFSGGKMSGRGVTVTPYFGYPFNKNLAFDATVGLGRTDVDTSVAGVSGSTRSDRNLGTLGLTYRENIGQWSLSARGALLTVRDKLGAYTLTNGTFVPDGSVSLTQLRFTGQAAYNAGVVSPFVSLTYINDLHRPDQAPVGGISPANDRDAWTPAIGIRFNADNSVYGSIQYSTERGRSEVKNNQFLFNLGIRF